MAFETSSIPGAGAPWPKPPSEPPLRPPRRSEKHEPDGNMRHRGGPGEGNPMTEPVLQVAHLSVDYEVGAGTFHAVQDVSFDLHPGRVLGIVGETGCGKSTLAHAIPLLLQEPPARIRSGCVLFRALVLAKLTQSQLPSVLPSSKIILFHAPPDPLPPAYRI